MPGFRCFFVKSCTECRLNNSNKSYQKTTSFEAVKMFLLGQIPRNAIPRAAK